MRAVSIVKNKSSLLTLICLCIPFQWKNSHKTVVVWRHDFTKLWLSVFHHPSITPISFFPWKLVGRNSWTRNLQFFWGGFSFFQDDRLLVISTSALFMRHKRNIYMLNLSFGITRHSIAIHFNILPMLLSLSMLLLSHTAKVTSIAVMHPRSTWPYLYTRS